MLAEATKTRWWAYKFTSGLTSMSKGGCARAWSCPRTVRSALARLMTATFGVLFCQANRNLIFAYSQSGKEKPLPLRLSLCFHLAQLFQLPICESTREAEGDRKSTRLNSSH